MRGALRRRGARGRLEAAFKDEVVFADHMFKTKLEMLATPQQARARGQAGPRDDEVRVHP